MLVRQLLTDVGLAVLLAVPTLALAKPNTLPAPAVSAQAADTMPEFAERSAARQPRLLS